MTDAEPATDSPSPTEADSFICPHCGKGTPSSEIGRWWAKRISGSKSKSEKKAKSSAENGKKGGRPRKVRPETTADKQI